MSQDNTIDNSIPEGHKPDGQDISSHNPACHGAEPSACQCTDPAVCQCPGDVSAAGVPPVPAELADIAPYDDGCFREKLERLVGEEGFEHAIRFVMPDVDYPQFVQHLLAVRNQQDFQSRIVGGFLEDLARKTSDGITMSGVENIAEGQSYTFISNHRDIVLDASFLNVCMIRAHRPITQIAIGNNLLIYDWITDLVKLNRSFIVKRDVSKMDAVRAARQLSSYIRYAISSRHESVWIAQRQGRAKDSNDVTQESLAKMLALAGETKDFAANLEEINILPVSIMYEYDPNDYLKVTEFVMRRRDPEFKKSQHDDLLSMETGLLSPKGRIHFHFGKPINEDLRAIEGEPRIQAVHQACALIDREIHQGYRLYPINYIAYDRLNGGSDFAGEYTEADIARFDAYIERQMSRIDIPGGLSDNERAYGLEMLLTMYANPLKNKLKAVEGRE